MVAKRGPKLETLSDCKKFVARLTREVYVGKLDASKGSRLANMVNILRGLIETSDIEQQLAQIQRRLDKASEGR